MADRGYTVDFYDGVACAIGEKPFYTERFDTVEDMEYAAGTALAVGQEVLSYRYSGKTYPAKSPEFIAMIERSISKLGPISKAKATGAWNRMTLQEQLAMFTAAGGEWGFIGPEDEVPE